jgi:septal ring factor EnvC (AmiA/AmiB activator)
VVWFASTWWEKDREVKVQFPEMNRKFEQVISENKKSIEPVLDSIQTLSKKVSNVENELTEVKKHQASLINNDRLIIEYSVKNIEQQKLLKEIINISIQDEGRSVPEDLMNFEEAEKEAKMFAHSEDSAYRPAYLTLDSTKKLIKEIKKKVE